jgi:hypothetical protein
MIIFPVVLYGCEALSRTLSEEHRLRVFENRVVRRIFEPERDEVMGGWRKPYNEELRNLYPSASIIIMIKSRMRWSGHVARNGEKGSAYRGLVGKPQGKKPLRIPRRRCDDDIKMDLREIGRSIIEWIDLAEDRDQWRALVYTVMNLWFT